MTKTTTARRTIHSIALALFWASTHYHLPSNQDTTDPLGPNGATEISRPVAKGNVHRADRRRRGVQHEHGLARSPCYPAGRGRPRRSAAEVMYWNIWFGPGCRRRQASRGGRLEQHGMRNSSGAAAVAVGTNRPPATN